MLVRHLPADSATVRAVAGPGAEWSTGDHLLATIIDLTAAANWQRAGDRRAPRPKPIPRPGVERPGQRVLGRGKGVTPDELRARWAAKQEAADGC